MPFILMMECCASTAEQAPSAASWGEQAIRSLTPSIPPTPTVPGLAPRRLAWHVLEAVAAGAYADVVLERQLGRSRLAGPDRGLATELSYGAIRQRLLLDAWIDAHGRVPAERQPPRLRWLLHLGLYQLLFCARVPVPAAISTSVELAKREGLARLAPVVNAVLRAVAQRRQALGLDANGDPWLGLALPEDAAISLSLRRSLPLPLVRDLLSWRDADQAEAFAAACNRPPPLDLRVQGLRTSREEQLAAFAAAGLQAEPLADLPGGISLPGRRGDLSRLPGFTAGHWSVQDRSAQRIAPLLDVHPGLRVLDACAAPGGKTTHLAELMGDQGELWAVDRSESRLERLRTNAERLGLGSIRGHVADAPEPEALPTGLFDRILLDAPCTGLGTLSRHADARWHLPSLQELLPLQRRLLDSLASRLAPDGLLLYATCSVDPRENEQQAQAFLERHGGWRLLHQQQWWPGEASGGDGFHASLLAPPGFRAGAEAR
ncbi:MAG: 16S rRNA (cytosine(967)-C(5))-methyltransferase RsmB [Synechococcaceae cyanobacterium]